MGGATHSVLTLISHMNKKGCDVVVVIPNEDTAFVELLKSTRANYYVVNLGFKAYPFYMHKIGYIKWPYHLLKTLLREYISKRKLEKILRKENIDIVHTNVGPIVCGYKACKKTGIPHVWHIREYGDKDFNIAMFPSRKDFRRCLMDSYVISITKDLLKYNQLECYSKAHVIYNGVRKNNDIRNVYPKDNYFLCASRISPEKGFDQIVRVFSLFHKKYPEFKLKIIGLDINNYTEHLSQMAHKLNIYNCIEFEGYKKNVSDYMAKAMALIVASPYEGFGRMTAEAAFAGCLVVGKNMAGTKEIMDIIGGFPFNSDMEMLEAMINVCELSENKYHLMAQFSQEQARRFFSEESYVDKVTNLYNSILQE